MRILYRPEIDGLRAIAVLLVVAYHSFPENFPGGFVGVDIFFVISGYLISSIICSSLQRNSFSVVEFYRHRIRRIFPSLILVMAAAAGIGWFALFGDEYKQLGLHILGGATFSSNFILMGEAGYFDNAAATKPLLHLWSLGIEEQFYLFWPLFLAVIWKKRWSLKPILIAIATVSFAVNIYFVSKNPATAFYSPLSRFWELMLGSLLAVGIDATGGSKKWFQNAVAGFGVFGIVSGFVFINSKMGIPGWVVLFPTVGAMGLIYAGSDAWVNRWVLSNKILVWIGLISYPLYLWHWSLLSFARIIEGTTPNVEIRVGAIFVSLVLSALTYSFIERPIRFGNFNHVKAVSLIVAMALVGLFGYSVFASGGVKFRKINDGFNDHQMAWENYKSSGCNLLLGAESAFCQIYGNKDNLTVAVIGDSTANALSPGLARLYVRSDTGLINIGHHGCPVVRGFLPDANWQFNEKNTCQTLAERAYSLILSSPSIKLVFISIFIRDLQFWVLPGLSPGASIEQKFEGLKVLINKDVADLRARGIHVVINYDTPNSPVNPRDCLQRPWSMTRLEKCDVPESKLIDRQPFLRLFEDFFANRRDVCILKVSDLLMKDGKLVIFDDSGHLLIRDDHHLSYNGSNKVAELVGRLSCVND